MASHGQDEGFHEIQLNGKQLVFLFMAATVVSVVIFLCGVLVGRGVRVERNAAEASALEGASDGGLSAARRDPAARNGRDSGPVPGIQGLSYPERLEKSVEAGAESLKPAPAVERGSKPDTRRAEDPKPTAPVAAAAAPAPRPPDESRSAPAPSDRDWVVQIAALNARGDADAIARRLTAKGYSAFVATPAEESGVYRVRVGPFKTRREADNMAGRLQKEEKFKPWVTR